MGIKKEYPFQIRDWLLNVSRLQTGCKLDGSIFGSISTQTLSSNQSQQKTAIRNMHQSAVTLKKHCQYFMIRATLKF